MNHLESCFPWISHIAIETKDPNVIICCPFLWYGSVIVRVVVQCINHSPIRQESGVRFYVETMQHHKRLNKWSIKAALMRASRVAPPSCWILHEPQEPWQDDQFASQYPTQMVAHGKLTSSHQITEANSCVEVLGKNLSYHTASVHLVVMGTWWSKNWKNCEWN